MKGDLIYKDSLVSKDFSVEVSVGVLSICIANCSILKKMKGVYKSL